MNNKISIPYSPLHIRSFFSLLRGCLSPEEICEYACKEKFPAVGITDINNLYGVVRFIKAAKRNGIKPVSGAIIRFEGQELFTAYIINRAGFSRLSHIISNILLHENPYIKIKDRDDYNPITDLLTYGWEGLLLVSDKISLLQKLMAHGKKGLMVKLTWGKSYIRELRYARQQGLPVIALNDAVVRNDSIHQKKDIFLYQLLRAIDKNITIGNLPENARLKPYEGIVSKENMENFFSAVPGALKQAAALAEESHAEEIINKNYIFPGFDTLSGDEAFSHLAALCNKGITDRYGPNHGHKRTEISKRLNYELSIIREKHFSSYFLVVQDIVSRCPRTCGRGSSASSIVSYLLGITHIDPLKYNLFFERFLNPGRKDPPDIDVDFPWDERDKVLEYVFEKYKGRSGMVANHVTFGKRSSIREPAKALGIPEEEIKKIIALWRTGREDKIPGYLKKISARIKGFPHYIGLHCGGVVITPGPITDYTHIQMSLAGYPVIAWEKDGTEEAGLVKIDLLGNRSLSVLRDTISLVKKRYGKTISWESFNPLKNKRTHDLIRKGHTLGIFYVESPATRQLLKKMKTGDFEHLVIASSIIRPAANKYIREYVKRLHEKTYTPIHPLIADTLKETLGIMVFQEDVSRVAIDLAGFSVEEADLFRKIISKKDRHYHLADFRDRFFSGGRSKDVPDNILQEVWEMILSFTGYSFCKAHSASYALVSYKLAYMKAYYPVEFMASVINNGGGFYSRQTYLNELKRMGYPILKPDVTKSRYKYSIEERDTIVKDRQIPLFKSYPITKSGPFYRVCVRQNTTRPSKAADRKNTSALRVGLSQLEDLSRNFIKKIIRKRKERPFCSFRDFIQRVKPGLPEIRVLIRSGALDKLSEGFPRPALFWLYFHISKDEELFLLPRVPEFISDYPTEVKLQDEAETLGILISQHPLTVFSKQIAQIRKKNSPVPLITSREIPLFVNKKVSIAGLIVTGKEVITKDKKMMIFVSFEDSYSLFETVFFPEAFHKHQYILNGLCTYLIHGKVEEDQGAISINVDDIERLSGGES
ncbi:MAG: DNA polymerase III subunit alpha [Spirochaetales bacterium]|nr:DNA polymerase III subunit alpha [Spirochaetales bacterium]